MFRIGQPVICVDDTNQSRSGRYSWLKKGNKYTIRWIGMYKHPNHTESVLSVRLEEVNRSDADLLLRICVMLGWDPETVDMPFKATRFRPLDERKTDISSFTEMLKMKEDVR